jgi:hypothetical protein
MGRGRPCRRLADPVDRRSEIAEIAGASERSIRVERREHAPGQWRVAGAPLAVA